MMRALLTKEFRALRPFVWCILGLLVLGYLFILGTEMPDDQRLDPMVIDQFIHDPVQVPTAMTETTMRIVPQILSVVTIQHREAAAPVMQRRFGQINIDRPRLELAESRHHTRRGDHLEA